MRKRLSAMLAVIMALMVCWNAACASTTDFLSLLLRMIDPDNPVHYTISTVETGEIEPVEGYNPSSFISALRDVVLTPVDLSETPDGQYVVLRFPDERIRYDFFVSEKDKNYIRRTNPDGSQELFRARLPDALFVTLYELIDMEAKAIYSMSSRRLKASLVVPAEGWIHDSLNGTCWMSDRVELQIDLPDEAFYQVTIRWGNSFDEAREWIYYCTYDTENDKLLANYIQCVDVKYDDAGEDMDVDWLYEGWSSAVFFLNEDGDIEIEGGGDGLLDDLVFTREETAE